MKKYVCLFLLFIPFLSFAQFHIAGSNNVSTALAKVIEDFPNHY